MLRWSWRVGFYSYSALGTDRYPPFTLADVPDYPARLEVDYPPSLSRGPCSSSGGCSRSPSTSIVSVFAGGARAGYGAANDNLDVDLPRRPDRAAGLHLRGRAAVHGRYPRQLSDFIIGMNRWVFRVVAYATLMTDEYPPFRLDMGEEEPRARAPAVDAMRPAPGLAVMSIRTGPNRPERRWPANT